MINNVKELIFDIPPNALTFSFDTDYGLIEQRNLGKRPQACKLCGAKGSFQTWLGTENFVGLKDEFNYFECPHCECLQIEEIPEDIGRYYAHDYYSYKPPEIRSKDPNAITDTRKILDIGCGAGDYLCFLASIGFINLLGCDPFIEQNLTYHNGVRIFKKSIHEMGGQYDVIVFKHSFEHMSDPHEVFKSLDRLLRHENAENGFEPKIEIEIPTFPNAAFDVYGPFWFQIDPPRHFFLHSVKSMQALCEESGFYIETARNDGAIRMFPYSRLYQHGVPFIQCQVNLNNPAYFTDPEENHAQYDAATRAAVSAGRGDITHFTIKRKKSII